MKLLPFDLQRALAGDKVVTRDGREVTQLFMLKLERSNELVGVVSGGAFFWSCSGCYWESGRSSDLDLFMAPKTVKSWVNFYSEGDARAFENKQAALQHANWNQDLIAIAVPVEFEEGYGCE